MFPADPQDENKIGIDGIQQFCDDLNLDPASISVLVVAWKFRAATQCEFSKKEFLDGMTELGCVSDPSNGHSQHNYCLICLNCKTPSDSGTSASDKNIDGDGRLLMVLFLVCTCPEVQK